MVLLENNLARVVGDFRDAPLPFDLVEWLDLRVAETRSIRKDFLPAIPLFLLVRVADTVAARRRL